MVFHWSLNFNKCPQISTIFLSILVDLNNAVVWMVPTRPLISKSLSPFINPLVTAPSAPITNGITVTFMFSVLYQGLGTYLTFCFLSAVFFFSFFFFFCWLSLGQVVWLILGDPFVSQNLREFCASHSSKLILGLSMFPLFVWSNLIFVYNSLRISYPTQSCLVLYSFCANLLHSLTIRLIVSSLSPLNVLFYCVVSIFALI